MLKDCLSFKLVEEFFLLFDVGQVFVLSAGNSTMVTNLTFPQFSKHLYYKATCLFLKLNCPLQT